MANPATVASPLSHIAICGAGISGLNLAGILSKELGSRVKLTIFERASADRDQGYGLDLDEMGQEAFARTGLYHRYWDISKPRSDSWAICPMHFRGAPPAAYLIAFRPKLLQHLLPGSFGAQPESNRAAFRDVLLEALRQRANTEVLFETSATEVCEIKQLEGSLSRAELRSADGSSLGVFDLVVDASGVHSPLRLARVNDEVKKSFTGVSLVHGCFNNTEETWPKEALELFARHGNLLAAGVKSRLIFQRYGVGDDSRAAMMYDIHASDGEEAIFREIGIERPTSRNTGIITDPERQAKVKAWLHSHMGDHFDPIWHRIIDSLDRVTVRDEFQHGETTLRENVSLPMVCIGDSLRNCGVGGGGNIALQDCIDLADALASPGVFTETGRCQIEALRAAEQKMLDRKNEHRTQKDQRYKLFATLAAKGHREFCMEDLNFSIRSFAGRLLARFCFGVVRPLFKAWYYLELRLGCAGSDSRSPIFTNVRKAIAKASTTTTTSPTSSS